ncbi:hypothetical protein [Candidatus Odyssella acanthamoebae]|uniref:Uncharacterized protein n=1 Tax=Candidatus Odyssella acanthamoebae TaxID=91604 RepID=A0A077ATJ6_9PROT|nr:hypothetical protein [Candidatus Paracaedibacter acanthamoebae]AIK96497.1 hypothetical protein ID47_06690 [Candidatus Paracaedibacter acanthamoebae]
MLSIVKNYVTSWKTEELAFSYELDCSVTPAGLTLTLHQLQTAFSLAITIQPSPDSLRISSFTLEEESYLGDLSQPLYDAALIEMVLQGLDLIAFCAQRFNKQEVNFMLSSDDADHLTSLKSLFQSISSHTTIHGKRQLLSLVIDEAFFETMESMTIQLHQKLWGHQKSDLVVRKYLQSADRTNAPVLSFLSLQKKQGLQDQASNVISFPKRPHRRTAI